MFGQNLLRGHKKGRAEVPELGSGEAGTMRRRSRLLIDRLDTQEFDEKRPAYRNTSKYQSYFIDTEH
ncbi:MAG: hypothetical protein AAF714_00140 [Pseudomonadota bacterium]